MRVFKYILLVPGLIFLTQCKEDEPSGSTDSFNRKEVIERLADDLVLPSYTSLNTELAALETSFNDFQADQSTAKLDAFKAAWLNAYIAWQEAALWEFGPAADEGLISAMNIYPTDTVQIANNLQGTYDLNSIAQFDAQGFPALEYFLFSNHTNWGDAAVLQYVDDVLSRMISKASTVQQAWNSSFRDEFVNAEGTDRGSALGQLFNSTFLPYVEVHQREAKFGIPGGQRTGQPLPGNVEGYYSRDNSQLLATHAFDAFRRAWLGMDHQNHVAGPSVLEYVKYMDDRNGTSLGPKLESQLDEIQLAIDGLDDDFYAIAQTNPQQLNNVWAKYQIMVFTIKTEISSALNVTISYIDSDGD